MTRESALAFPLDEEAAAFVEQWFQSTQEDGFDGDASVLPQSYPFFNRLSADDDGLLWVFRDVPGENSTEIDLFDAGGRYLGTVPASINVSTTGTQPRLNSGYLVGTSVDNLGVQYVEVFRVESG